MPTYGYRCPKCGHEFDKFQKITDSTRAKCPECGTRAERLISGGGGVLFKGSGFYETDYKRASAGKSERAESEGSKEKSTPEKSESKTESAKPASKSSDGPKKGDS